MTLLSVKKLIPNKQIILLGTLFLVLSCNSEQERQQRSEIIDNIRVIELNLQNEDFKIPFKLTLIDSLGAKSKQGYVFGLIGSIISDQKGNLYVHDSMFSRIKIFGRGNMLLETYEISEGRGPGEFLEVSTMEIAPDESKIYIFDANLKRVTLMDQNFNYITSFNVNTWFSIIYDGQNNTVFLANSQFNLLDRSLVQAYNYEGELLFEFGKRHSDYFNYRKQDLQFMHPVFLVQSKDYYIITYSYPYEIRFFNKKNTDLVKKTKFNESFMDDFFMEGQWLKPGGRTLQPFIINNRYLITTINKLKNNKTYLHVLDLEKEKSLGLLDLSKVIPLANIPIYIGDYNERLKLFYFFVQKPFPKIYICKIAFI